MNTVLMAALGIASIYDWRFRRIPNWLTFSMIIAGLLLQTFFYGLDGLKESVLGFLLGIFLLYIPFQMGGVGGGDVKLLGALGAFLGPVSLLRVFLISAIFGGLFSLIEILRRKIWKATCESFKHRFLFLALQQKLASESEITFSKNQASIPYAISMALGYAYFYFTGGIL